MLIKRIRTKTRPSTDISYTHNYGDEDECAVYRDSCIVNGNISSRTLQYSEDDLTQIEEIKFSSIENCIVYDKTIYDIDYANGKLLQSLQYMADNSLTHTISYVFEQ
jgi:hypothetical protein